MTTLISFLGKGQNNHGYRTADYRFADGHISHEQKYIGLALREKLQPSRLILLGTSSSMWDVFLESGMTTLENQWLSLSDAVQDQNVTAELLHPFESFLTESLKTPVQCILIPFARTEQEQIGVLSHLANTLHQGEEVVLDVTHGFRHLPMLALVAARFLQKIRRVNVNQIYYGALDMTESQQTPVLELGSLLAMLDWVDALSTFDKDGDYGVFSSLLTAQGFSDADANMLKQAAFFERTTNSSNARQKLSTVFPKIEAFDSPLFTLFKSQLIERLRWFRRKNRGLQEQELAREYLGRRDYLRAVIYGMEGMISHRLIEEGNDENNYDWRNDISHEMSSSDKSYKKLKFLRNSLAHGIPPKNDENEITDVLRDEEKLYQSLTSRFKHLLD